MDSDAEIENHERQLELTLLQLKIAKSVAEAKQFCTTDLDDFDEAKKKYMCVYCHMSKKSRVGRSGLIFFFYYRQNRK